MQPKPNRIALYARVSDAAKGQDTDNQLIALRDYCAQQNWIVVHEYVDHVSGKRSENRKQFQAMMSDASRRLFDIVVVWALDRLSREGVLETFEHIKTLKSYNVEFESYTERFFRTTGPAGELMIAVAAWIAKQESARRSERARAAIARLRKAKTTDHLGRPRKIMDRDRVRQLRKAGRSIRQIAAEMKTGHGTIQRILKAA